MNLRGVSRLSDEKEEVTVDEFCDVLGPGHVSASSSLSISNGVVYGFLVQQERHDVCSTQGCREMEWTGIRVDCIG